FPPPIPLPVGRGMGGGSEGFPVGQAVDGAISFIFNLPVQMSGFRPSRTLPAATLCHHSHGPTFAQPPPLGAIRSPNMKSTHRPAPAFAGNHSPARQVNLFAPLPVSEARARRLSS